MSADEPRDTRTIIMVHHGPLPNRIKKFGNTVSLIRRAVDRPENTSAHNRGSNAALHKHPVFVEVLIKIR